MFSKNKNSLIPDKATLCNTDTNVCTYCLHYLFHKSPEQIVIMTLDPIQTIYTGLCNTEPPLQAQLLRMVLFHHMGDLSVVSLMCYSQYTDSNGHGFVHRLLVLVLIKEQASKKFILFNISPLSIKITPSSSMLRNRWLILLTFLFAFNRTSPLSSAAHLPDNDGVYDNIQT